MSSDRESRDLISLGMNIVEEAYFSKCRHIVGWSSRHKSVAVYTTSGAVLVDRTVSEQFQTIESVAINSHNVVSVIGKSTNADEGTVVGFMLGGTITAVSNPVSLNVLAEGQPVVTQGLRVESYDCTVVSSVGSRQLLLVCRQRQGVAITMTLDTPIAFLAPAISGSSLFAVDRSGKITLIDVVLSGFGLEFVELASIDTLIGNISQVALAGRSLLWILAGDGRLWASKLRVDASAAEGQLAFTPCSFRYVTGERVDGFSVNGSSFLWGDSRSSQIALAAIVPDNEVAGGMVAQLTTVDVTNTDLATVTSIEIPLDASEIVCFSVQNRSWDFLLRHPRKPSLEFLTIDTAAADVAATKASVPNHGNALCAHIAWAPNEELGSLRQQCEVLLRNLQNGASQRRSSGDVRRAMEELGSLQHAAMAFLRRENESTQCGLGAEHSVAHSMIKKLNALYYKLFCELFLVNIGLGDSQDVPLRDVVEIELCRTTIEANMAVMKDEFHGAFDLNERGEDHSVNYQRWGGGVTTRVLAIDLLCSSLGLSSSNCTLRNVAESVTIGNLVDVAMILMYVGASSASKEVDSNVTELLRSFDVPRAHWSLAQLAFDADHAHSAPQHRETPAATDSNLWSNSPKMVSAVVDGLMAGGLFDHALSTCRSALATTPRHQFPLGLASKLIFLVFRVGDAAFLSQLAVYFRGTQSGQLAARALGHCVARTESLLHADGLYHDTSDEFHVVENVIQSYASQGQEGNVMSASLLLFELYLAGKRFAQADALGAHMSRQLATSRHAQRLHAVRDHLRALLPASRVGENLESESGAPSSSARSAPPPASRGRSTPVRRSLCLRERDEELNDAARSSSQASAQRGAGQRHAGGYASSQVPPYGIPRSSARPPGLPLHYNVHSLHHNEEAPVLCEAVCGKKNKMCGRKRPCPYHEPSLK